MTDGRPERKGLWVAFLGPDGSGKSSVQDRYVPEVGHLFADTQRYHLRPRLLRGSAAGMIPNFEPHGQQSRGAVASVIKLFYLWCDYLLGFGLQIRPALRRGVLVIFDRYYYDLLVDARRFRYGGPPWLAAQLARWVPRPDLILILDVPAEVLQARKQEVSPLESQRQMSCYRKIAQAHWLRGRTRLIDAAQPLDHVVQQCVAATRAELDQQLGREPGPKAHR
jgi:thymidylate kinase